MKKKKETVTRMVFENIYYILGKTLDSDFQRLFNKFLTEVKFGSKDYRITIEALRKLSPDQKKTLLVMIDWLAVLILTEGAS